MKALAFSVIEIWEQKPREADTFKVTELVSVEAGMALS